MFWLFFDFNIFNFLDDNHCPFSIYHIKGYYWGITLLKIITKLKFVYNITDTCGGPKLYWAEAMFASPEAYEGFAFL